jgi:hypothetical protein
MRGGAGLLRMMAAGAGAQAAALKGVSLELTGVPQARIVSFPTRRGDDGVGAFSFVVTKASTQSGLFVAWRKSMNRCRSDINVE